MKSPTVKVVEHRPLRRALAIAGIGAVAIGLAVSGYQLGKRQTETRLSEASEMEQRFAQAQEHIADLERRNADIKLSSTVDGDTQDQLRETIKQLRDEIADGREELLFYRQLMAPSEAERGLRVERLDLHGREGARTVSYRLLLTQVAERQQWIQGRVTVDVTGMRGATEEVLSLTDLNPDETYPLAFKFRYFQDFTGNLNLPDGFEPTRVTVAAEVAGQNGKRVERTFDWKIEEG